MFTAKIVLGCCAAAIFIVLGCLDLYVGVHPGHPTDLRVGIASLCLGVANGIFFIPWG